MRLFACDHSLLGNCFFCRLFRGQVSPRALVYFFSFIIGLILSLFLTWK